MFSKIIDAKMNDDVFIGSQIAKLLNDLAFQENFSEIEVAA